MDKIGYLKTIAGTNIREGKLALIVLALNADGLLIRKRKISMRTMAARTQCARSTAVRHMATLEAHGLIKSTEVKRKAYWQLPSEEALMKYTPPARKKRKAPENFKPKKRQTK